MNMESKIKSLFSTTLLRQLAAICDTRRIEDNLEKMDLLFRLLRYNGIECEQLGGATNRFVGMADGYAVKFAVDRQGYKDNLMEYALTCEMQPNITKSYETNGYILIQECVRLMTVEEWRARKIEILKILDMYGREYLLGDVGYNDVNMTNWGIRDDGTLVMLDYAYCHRLTEYLFICPSCGSLLTYDQNFTNVLCTDRANCHEKYSYNQIKAIQGNKIDWEMIEEKKKRSVTIYKGETYAKVDVDSDTLLDSKTFIIRSYRDLELFKEATKMRPINRINDVEGAPDVMRKLTMAYINNDQELISKLESKLYGYENTHKPEFRCIIDPEFQERMDNDEMDEKEAMLKGYDYNPSEGKKEGTDTMDLSKYSFESLMELVREETTSENKGPEVQVQPEQVSESINTPEPEIGDIKNILLNLDKFSQEDTDDGVVVEDTITITECEEGYTDEPVDYIPEDCVSDEMDDDNVAVVLDDVSDDDTDSEEVIFDNESLSVEYEGEGSEETDEE